MASILSDSTNSNDEQQQLGVRVQQAYRMLQQGRITQSIELYERIIEENERCWRAYQNLGVAYIMMKQYGRANTLLVKYVQHVPRDPMGHDSLGVSYSQLDDPIRAICSFVNSINLAPTYYTSYYNLGVVLGKLGLFDYALNVYLYCLELQPNYINAMNNLADIYKKQGRVEEAIEMFKEIVELDPGYGLAVKNLGNCYFGMDRFYEAVVSYMRVGDVEGQHESVLFNMAICLDHYHMYSQAAAYALLAFQKSNNTPNSQSKSFNQIFLASTFLAKQLHCIFKVIRCFLQLRKQPPKKLLKRFYKYQTQIFQCLSVANQYPIKYYQVEGNLEQMIINVAGYGVRMGRIDMFKLKQEHLRQYQDFGQIEQFVNQQRRILGEMAWWRKYTRKLIRRVIIRKDWQFQKQKKHLIQTFGKPFYFDLIAHQYKTHTYISRRFNHNLKRLILKRRKFISKYLYLNTQCKKLFRYKPLDITLTEMQ